MWGRALHKGHVVAHSMVHGEGAEKEGEDVQDALRDKGGADRSGVSGPR